jgi:hypothetical protein
MSPEEKHQDEGAGQNTDRKIWREREGDAYSDSIHVTAQGAIGIDCGGMVYVKPVREWHKLAALSHPAPDVPGSCACPEHGNWIAVDDVNRLVRELDVLLNGEDGAAKQASLCDIVSQVASQHYVLVRRTDVPSSEEIEAIRARHEAMDKGKPFFDVVGKVHTDRATLLRLLDAAREELREGGWCFDMEKAPKDGTYILAIVRQTDDLHMGRQAGRVFCIRYESFGDKYGGWAVYPGYGGAPDSFFTAWRRIDVPPTRAQGESS